MLGAISKVNFGWILAYSFFSYLCVLGNVLVVTACTPLVDRSIVKNTSGVDETTSNGLDAYSLEHLRLVLVPVKELDELEALLCLPVSMSKCKCRAISTRKESVHASSNEGVD